MIYAVVTIIAVFVISRFLISLDKDKKVLESQPLEIKFGRIIEVLDEKLFDGNGGVTVLDLRSLNIYNNNKTQIIQFFYSTSNLNISWRSKLSGKEIIVQKNIPNVNDWNPLFQEQIADSFIKQIEMKIRAYNALSNKFENKPPTSKEQSKIEINSLFYAFCFSKETAKIFLEENNNRENVARIIALSYIEKNKFLETAFKLFLKKIHNIDLGQSEYNFYNHNEFKFFIEVRREFVDGQSSYFEIMSNDIENVIDNEGFEYAIAQEFIIYMEDAFPVAIFVVVYDPIIKSYALREVYENGQSAVIKFFQEYMDTEVIDFLEEYVSNKIF